MSPLLWTLLVFMGAFALVGLVILVERPERPSRKRIIEVGPSPTYACKRCGQDFGSWERDIAKSHDCVAWIAHRQAALREDARYLEKSRKQIEELLARAERTSLRVSKLEGIITKPPDALLQTQLAVLEDSIRSASARIRGLEGDVAKLQSRRKR